MGARKGMWGGPRKGAGRPPGKGPGPSPDARTQRVVVMLSPSELRKLQDLADEKDLPLGTAAYEIVARALRRRR